MDAKRPCTFPRKAWERGKSKELKRTNRLKHKIKVELDNNPDFYQPLADKLEKLIIAWRENRISQLELFEEYDKIQEKILNKSKEAEDLGFKSDREFAVFKTLENKIAGGEVREVTEALFVIFCCGRNQVSCSGHAGS